MRSNSRTYVIGLLALICCTAFQSPVPEPSSALSWYDLNDKKPSAVDLPTRLREISGLAMSEDGRLFGHGDEKGVIYQIDYQSGKIIKSFSLGRIAVRADFEGLAIAGNRFFLVTSWGNLYEFSEGKDEGYVSYQVHRTPLTLANDVEGLCYDPDTHSLLLACKEYPGRGYAKNKAILLPVQELRRKSRHKLFNPSGIERHPKTGTFFVIAAQGESIIEVSSSGDVLDQVTFRSGVHKQPEGITFSPDFTLLISDEGGRKRAKLTRYPVRKKIKSHRKELQ